MLTFKAIGLHTASYSRGNSFWKKSFVPVSSYQAMSTDDLEHTNTGDSFHLPYADWEQTMIAPQHTPETQFLLGSNRMGNFWPFLNLSLDFFPPHSTERHLMLKLFCQTSSRGQNRRGRSGQSSRSSHFPIMDLPAHGATQQKCLQHIMSILPPPPAQQPVLPQDKVAHIILLARTKAFQIGQGMNKQQLLQQTARRGASPLLLAALNQSSPWGVLPIISALKDFPANSGWYTSCSGRQHQLYFPVSCTS